jgi:hypothetical protein
MANPNTINLAVRLLEVIRDEVSHQQRHERAEDVARLLDLSRLAAAIGYYDMSLLLQKLASGELVVFDRQDQREPSDPDDTCDNCKGSGIVEYLMANENMLMSCRPCDGTGVRQDAGPPT